MLHVLLMSFHKGFRSAAIPTHVFEMKQACTSASSMQTSIAATHPAVCLADFAREDAVRTQTQTWTQTRTQTRTQTHGVLPFDYGYHINMI
jgi:hypothetical protein